MILIIALAIGAGYYEIKLLIPVGYPYSSLVGDNYEDVVDKLKQSGFSSVMTEEISDLKVSQIAKEYVVTDIKIGFAQTFSEKSKYPSNFPVKVTYHDLKKNKPK